MKNGPSTITIESSVVNGTNKFIQAYNGKENSTILIKNSSINTKADLIDIHIQQTGNIAISIIHSNLSSKGGYLLQFKKQQVPVGLGNVANYCLNDIFESTGNTMFNFELYSPEINSIINNSFINKNNIGTAMKVNLRFSTVYLPEEPRRFPLHALSIQLKPLNESLCYTTTNLTIAAIEIYCSIYVIDIKNYSFVRNSKCINISKTEINFNRIVLTGNELLRNYGNGITTIMLQNSVESSIDLV